MQHSQSNPLTSLDRLASLVKIKTVSHTDYSLFDMEEFCRFKTALRKIYPKATGVMEELDAGPLAIVYRWQAKNSSLKPVLFTAHFDVVAAEEDKWFHPPFGGVQEEGFLYGRGTLDIKHQIAAYFEAIEELIIRGLTPERSIYFAFGGDEEVAGVEGAGKISDLFRKMGITFEYLMDEGGIISTDGMKTFTLQPIALIGIEEKGMLSLALSMEGGSGHSSMPPRHSVIGKLAEAVKLIERNPFPRRLENSVARMLKAIGECSRFPFNLLFKLMPLTIRLFLWGFLQTGRLIP